MSTQTRRREHRSIDNKAAVSVGGVVGWRGSGVNVWWCECVAVVRFGGVAVWMCGGVKVWQCGVLAVWRCSGVAV